jgi:RND family efflux transporter MFP subunit
MKKLKVTMMSFKNIASKKIKIISAVLLLAGALIIYPACSGPAQDRAESEADSTRLPSGDRVRLSEAAIQTSGLEISELKLIKINQELRVPGEIQFNPRSYVRLTARTAGRVDDLLVYEGYPVRSGQTVLRLFSLQFIEAASELKLAEERYERLIGQNSEVQAAARTLVSSARKKLKLLGLTEDQIEALNSSQNEDNLLPVTSPLSGQIIKCEILKGDRVEEGTLLMEVASLDRLWVEARVQEKDIELIQPGQPAVVEVSAFPGRSYQGQITFLAPVIETSTRTVKARLEVKNEKGELRPGMFADITILLPGLEALAVPEEAVQTISGQTVVFVPETQGVFVIKQIEASSPVNGWRPVVKGLAAGDRYVSRGSFILKSELLKNTFGEE